MIEQTLLYQWVQWKNLLDYNIEFKSSVKKDLKKISREIITKILLKIENELPDIALQQPNLQGKFKHLKKYRVGDYRIIYAIKDSTILILRIANRKDAYKN